MFEFLKEGIHIRVNRKIFHFVIIPATAVIIFLIAFLIARGCGGNRTTTTTIVGPPVSDVVKEFYSYLKQGDLDRARLMVTDDFFLTDDITIIEANQRIKQFLETERLWTETTRLKILSEKEQPPNAIVVIEQTYPAENKKFVRAVFLLKKGSGWMIAGIGMPPTQPQKTPENE